MTSPWSTATGGVRVCLTCCAGQGWVGGLTQPATMFKSIGEAQAIAKEKLPKFVYDYYASGAETETTLRDNLKAFGRYRFAGSRDQPCPPAECRVLRPRGIGSVRLPQSGPLRSRRARR
mmetsp:Transcript_727/g.2467  ORF Transcript_727/g.2467 Transcript_727/m.2467 type:complete len:119 (+) Transcript_727:628-984(+)